MSNTKEYIAKLQERATAGEADAQNSLGCAYHNGDGVPKNYSTAMMWYLKAAEQGDSYAQCNIAVLYRYGLGVTKDLGKAFDWYKKSAEQGNAGALEALGVFYDFGYGVEKDSKKAAFWYLKAAQKGRATAQNNLGSLYEHGNGVEKDIDLAIYWYKKAAFNGSEYGQCNLGILLEEGRGLLQDYGEAHYWYEKSAHNGHERAKKRLELLKRKYDKNGDLRLITCPLVSNNPYRIMGVYCNATPRNLASNKSKMLSFAKVGKSVTFEVDDILDGLYPDLYTKQLNLFKDYYSEEDVELSQLSLNQIYNRIVDEREKLDSLYKSDTYLKWEEEHDDADYDEEDNYTIQQINATRRLIGHLETAYDLKRHRMLLPNRKENEIGQASTILGDNKERLRYALFWFSNVTSQDCEALKMISSRNVAKAIDVWDNRDGFSSLQNMAALSFITGDNKLFVSCISELIHEEKYRTDFVAAICDSNYIITETELSQLFMDTLLKEIPNVDWLRIFKECCDCSSTDENYLEEYYAKTPIHKILKSIETTSKTKAEKGIDFYRAIERLKNVSIGNLVVLSDIYGTKEDYRYTQVCDKAATQILQSAQQYHQKFFTKEFDTTDNCIELTSAALELACNPALKSEIDDAYQEIVRIRKENVPPKEIFSLIGDLNSMLSDAYNRTNQTIKDAMMMLETAAPKLVKIKELEEKDNKYYLEFSTSVAECALSIAISVFNKSFDEFDKLIESSGGSYYGRFYNSKISSKRDEIKRMLSDICALLVNIDQIETNTTFIDRYKRNKKVFIEQSGDMGININSYKPTIDLRTEYEFFSACRTIEDYQNYLKRFVDGKFRNDAKIKVSKLEKEDDDYWNECVIKGDYKKYLDTYPKGRHQQEAQTEVDKEISRKCEAEKSYWNACVAQKAYSAYMKVYPNGMYAKQAKEGANSQQGDGNRIVLIIFMTVIFLIMLLVLLTTANSLSSSNTSNNSTSSQSHLVTPVYSDIATPKTDETTTMTSDDEIDDELMESETLNEDEEDDLLDDISDEDDDEEDDDDDFLIDYD